MLVRPHRAPSPWLLAPALLLALAGCVAGPAQSPAPSCRARCQTTHDTCVVDARSEPAIQACDADETWCNNHCGT
jgi:hypothetical protein